MKKYLSIIIVCTIVVLCYNIYLYSFFETIYLYPKNKEQSVTIIYGFKKCYIMPGIHKKVEGEYISLDISHLYRLGTEVFVCWWNYQGWEIALPDAIVVENKLDSKKYEVFCALPVKGEFNTPNASKFFSSNCGSFDLGYKTVFRPSADVVLEDGQKIWIFK